MIWISPNKPLLVSADTSKILIAGSNDLHIWTNVFRPASEGHASDTDISGTYDFILVIHTMTRLVPFPR